MSSDLPGFPEPGSLPEELEFWQIGEGGKEASLADLVNRVLDRGVVIVGNVTISVAGVDLVFLGLNAVLTSVSAMKRRDLLREPEAD